MTYQAPVRDYVFLLRDVLQLERYANLPAFADASRANCAVTPWSRTGCGRPGSARRSTAGRAN